jgi:hypothetical protein
MKQLITQYHMHGEGLCGRAIRVRELSAAEIEENGVAAAGMVNADDKTMKLMQIEIREGVKLMLVAVSKKAGLKPEEVAKLRAADWEQLSLLKLNMDDSSQYFYDNLFPRSKDHALLCRLFRRMHSPKESDIDAIVEKGCPVATEEEVPSIGTATGTGG